MQIFIFHADTALKVNTSFLYFCFLFSFSAYSMQMLSLLLLLLPSSQVQVYLKKSFDALSLQFSTGIKNVVCCL